MSVSHEKMPREALGLCLDDTRRDVGELMTTTIANLKWGFRAPVRVLWTSWCFLRSHWVQWLWSSWRRTSALAPACTHIRAPHVQTCLQAPKRCRTLIEACLTAVPTLNLCRSTEQAFRRTLEHLKRLASSQPHLISSDLFGSLTAWLPGGKAWYIGWLVTLVFCQFFASCLVDEPSQSVTPIAPRWRVAKRKLCRSGAKHCRLDFLKYFCYIGLRFSD